MNQIKQESDVKMKQYFDQHYHKPQKPNQPITNQQEPNQLFDVDFGTGLQPFSQMPNLDVDEQGDVQLISGKSHQGPIDLGKQFFKQEKPSKSQKKNPL